MSDSATHYRYLGGHEHVFNSLQNSLANTLRAILESVIERGVATVAQITRDRVRKDFAKYSVSESKTLFIVMLCLVVITLGSMMVCFNYKAEGLLCLHAKL